MRSLLRFNNQLKIATSNNSIELRYSTSRLGFSIRSIVTTCRAVLLPRFGGADVLQLRDDVSVPDLKSNEVLVRVRAVSVNPLDTRVSFSHILYYTYIRIYLLFHYHFYIVVIC